MTTLLTTPLALGLAEQIDLSTWALIKGSSGVVIAVMVLLALMSVVSWYIIGYKYLFIAQATRETDAFLDAFWRSKDIEAIYKVAQSLSRSPLSHIFLAGYTELSKLQQGGASEDRSADLENVGRSLEKGTMKEIMRLESAVPFLATTGSAAPFIGLFGTVWGILVSFQAMGNMDKVSLGVIAPKIAEALIATAIGLVAAIPAVMAYNYFVRRIRVLTSEMETFSKDFLNIVRRNFLK